MTQQEFENLFEQPVTPAEFDVINSMYMQRENESKQAFVARLKKMDLPNLLGEFAVIFKAVNKEKDDATAEQVAVGIKLDRTEVLLKKTEQELTELQQRHHDFVSVVAVSAHNYDTDAIYKACAKEMGVKQYYRTLQAADCTPTKTDLNIFVETLN